MRRPTAALVALALAVAVPAGRAQQPPQPPPRAPGAVTAGVQAVLVDVVVRDRRGQPVRDLKATDFQILEDKVPQTIGSFAPVFDGAAPSAPAAAADAAASPAAARPPAVSAGPPIAAFVFDRLTPEARRLAVRAAQEYLGSDPEVPNYIGVFGIDLGLAPYAPFTRDGRVLRQALAKVAAAASAGFNSSEQREQRKSADRQAAIAADVAAGATAVGGAGASGAMGTAPGEARLAQMQSNMIQAFEVMERDQQGYSTTNGLFAIIGALGRLPGRKSLVLFSEGLALPPAVQRLFLGVIDAANRANVSIYTMDAAGLRAESEQAKIRDQVNEAGKRGINSAYAGNAGTDAPLTKALEGNEDVLRQDPQSALGDLAQGTGGLFFDGTNDLKQGFDRIDGDLRNYYLVGYTPTNDAFDGRFRTIAVRVNRPGVTVAARKGYFAVRDTGGMPVNTWEAPALGALERKPVPNAFPVRAAALLFPERDRPGLVPVVVDFRTAPITFQAAADGKTYTSDFAVLVRFLDQQNRVLQKVSQHYTVNGPIGELERARQGDVIFYREPELPPGVYTMETVVHDTPSGQSSVRFSTVEVPAVDPSRLRMSSLVLVKRGEKLPETDRRGANPLVVNGVVLYPNLGEPVSKAATELGFYFAVYPVRSRQPLTAGIEVLENGKPVAELPMPLAAADGSGRIQQIGRLPLGPLAPGTYELRAVVRHGTERVSRSTLLRVIE